MGSLAARKGSASRRQDARSASGRKADDRSRPHANPPPRRLRLTGKTLGLTGIKAAAGNGGEVRFARLSESSCGARHDRPGPSWRAMRVTGLTTRALAILALGLGLCAARGSLAQTSSVDRGRELVQRDCAMCHAVGPTGASPNPASPAFRDLNLRYPIDDLAEALAEGIIIGHPEMPQFQFSADDVADIIKYLKSIQTRQPAEFDSTPSGFPHSQLPLRKTSELEITPPLTTRRTAQSVDGP